MSHDIRTPMNAIVGMTAIASAHIDDAEQVKDCLRKITLSGKHLLGLINDVLDMSKIESGKLTLNMEVLSLRETMETIWDIIRPQTEQRKQTFDATIENVISERVYCDSVRINQVLINLLGNAVKFTPPGGSVAVSLRQEESPKGGAYVRTRFQVTDTGVGMSEEYQKKIFEAFSREDNLRIRKTEGAGLGMAITKHIVDAMGGAIDVESEQGKGSAFRVTLDLKRAEDETRDGGQRSLSPEGEAKEAAAFSMEGLRILLAEDNELNTEIATMILSEYGVDVEHGEDGKAALEMFKRSPERYYDVILMDLRMPNMNGFEATRAIRSLSRPDAKSVPVIAMSADAFADDVQRCLEAGMDGHVAKPIDIDLLMKTLSKFL
ncbi:MAG: response regulator [Oscillospiraceae bacterium]|nr:response regulator [Oscillospiraceae bacterium]